MKKILLTLVIAMLALLMVACGGGDVVENVAESVAETAGDAVDAAGDMAEGAVDAAGDAVDAAGDMAEGAVDAAGDAAEAVVDTAGDAAEAVAETAGDAVDAAGDMAEGAVDAAGDAVDAAGDMAEGAVDAAGDAVDAAGDMAEGAVDAAGDAAEAVAETAGDAADMAGDAAEEVVETVEEVAEEVVDTATGGSSTYAINTEESSLGWRGAKAVGSAHIGGVSISGGSLVVADGALTEGSFVIDMTSITNSDLGGGMADRLLGHLNSDDFFDTANFPTAELVITSAEPTGNENEYAVVADLTVKGTTAPVEFTAIASEDGGSLTAEADIVFDRTVYDVMYGSGVLGTVGDDLINDEIEMTVALVAADTSAAVTD